MRARTRFSLAAAALATACLCGCDTAPTGSGGAAGEKTSGPITIGLAGPFTGNSSEFGAQIKMGVDLWADETNAAGGLNGRQVKIEQGDDAGKAEQAQSVATNLAGNEDVLAVIGHFNSSCSLAGKGIYDQAKVVMFSPGSTNVDVTKGSPYIYRNIFTDDFQGQSLAQYGAKVLNLKNVAILFDNDDYGSGLKESFKKKAQELGMNVVAEQAYNQSAPDFRSQLTTIQAAQPTPDAILVAGLYNEAANIARQARGLGINTQIIAGDGVFSQQYITLAGDAAEGTYVTCPFLFDLSGEKGQKFSEAFRKKYNKDPDAWAALSYDAVSLVGEALKQKGFTREAVREHLETINSPETAYDGLTGKTYFDEQGDSKKPVQVAQVKGSKFVPAEMQLGVDGNPVPVARADAQGPDAQTTASEASAPAASPAADAAATTAPAL